MENPKPAPRSGPFRAASKGDVRAILGVDTKTLLMIAIGLVSFVVFRIQGPPTGVQALGPGSDKQAAGTEPDSAPSPDIYFIYVIR